MSEKSMYDISMPGCLTAKIEAVIKTTSIKGSGTTTDPFYETAQYWSLEGALLFEKNLSFGSINGSIKE